MSRGGKEGRFPRTAKNSFSCISSSTVNQFTSIQDQNDQLPILHICSNTFFQRKCSAFLQSEGRMSQWPPGPCTHLFIFNVLFPVYILACGLVHVLFDLEPSH